MDHPKFGKLEVVHSFAEAERCDREEMWALTPDERMAILEDLRRRWYGQFRSEPAFPGVLEVSARP
ncbi:MAG: hypothetical protein OHK0021_05450 [Bryobacter sp.]